MQDYTKLLVWQRARSLTVSVHELSRAFPLGIAPGLRSQLLRATMSIATNVAEGAARDSRADFARFVSIAAASSSEVEHHLNVASDLGLIDGAIVAQMVARVVEIRRMLCGLRRALLSAQISRDAGRERASSGDS